MEGAAGEDNNAIVEFGNTATLHTRDWATLTPSAQCVLEIEISFCHSSAQFRFHELMES